MSESYFADLVRYGQVAGADARPDDYDQAERELARAYGWAKRQRLDTVAAVVRGLQAAFRVLDPRDQHVLRHPIAADLHSVPF
jgi:hypothetical protein